MCYRLWLSCLQAAQGFKSCPWFWHINLNIWCAFWLHGWVSFPLSITSYSHTHAISKATPWPVCGVQIFLLHKLTVVTFLWSPAKKHEATVASLWTLCVRLLFPARRVSPLRLWIIAVKVWDSFISASLKHKSLFHPQTSLPVSVTGPHPACSVSAQTPRPSLPSVQRVHYPLGNIIDRNDFLLC